MIRAGGPRCAGRERGLGTSHLHSHKAYWKAAGGPQIFGVLFENVTLIQICV